MKVHNTLISKRLRITAACMAITMLTNVAAPTVTWALSSNIQPEFASYEGNDSTDMVSLITGDFSYQIPAVTIPGPEASVTLPIFYHAGIQVEQEASWVGLGWNINPGAIQRNVVNYPDDYYDDAVYMSNTDPGTKGWMRNYGIYQDMYTTETGRQGQVSALIFGVKWDKGRTDAGVLGIYSDGTVNGMEFVMGAVTIATLGTGAAAAAATNATTAFVTSQLIQEGIGIGVSAGMALAANKFSPSANLQPGVGWYSYEKKRNFKKEWEYRLNSSEHEFVKGPLYFGNASKVTFANVSSSDDIDIWKNNQNTPTTNMGFGITTIVPAGSSSNTTLQEIREVYDVQYNSRSVHAYSVEPATISYDVYSVMGAGISGSIEPYRLDVGSVSLPRRQANDQYKFKIIPYENYKPQFMYSNEIENAYTHSFGKLTNGTILNQLDPGLNIYINTNNRVAIDLDDLSKLDYQFDGNTNKFESNRSDGTYQNKEIARSKKVHWFSNKEITNGVADGILMQKSDINRADFPIEGIGGFVIEGIDGTKYHYSIPVYNRGDEHVTFDINNQITKQSRMRYHTPYATNWLLTAVTGRDYIDRNNNGQVDEDDWGYWAKYEYGRTSNYYQWSFPYVGEKKVQGSNDYYSFSSGIREMYYLDAIKTRSHTGLFIKSPRLDNKGTYGDESLKLDEIIVLSNQDYATLVSQYALSKSNGVGYPTKSANSFHSIYDYTDISTSARTFIHQHQLSKTVFEYDYSLCPGTLNSFDLADSEVYAQSGTRSVPANKRNGKLTLKKIYSYSAGNALVLPPTTFEYNSPNPAYNVNTYDAWGYYNPSGSTSDVSHDNLFYTPQSDAWSLTKIISPTGAVTEVEYENDSYSSIAGVSLIDYYKTESSLTQEPYVVQQGTSCWIAALNYSLKVLNRDVNPIHFFESGVEVTYNNLSVLIKKQGSLGWIFQTQNYGDRVFHSIVDQNKLQLYYGNSLTYPCDFTVEGSNGGTVELPYKSSFNKIGGGIRVKSIKTTGAGTELITQYNYSNGILSQEPIGTSHYHHENYELPNWPSTPVMYENVTVNQVVGGVLKSKIEYAFRGPRFSDLSVSRQAHADFPFPTDRHLKFYTLGLTDLTSKIGSIQSITSYNGQGQLITKKEFTYTHDLPNKQGQFYESTLLTDRTSDNADNYYRHIRTKKISKPYVLTANKETDQFGNQVITENLEFDFLTGGVLKSESTDALGQVTTQTTVPAYLKYPHLGYFNGSGYGEKLLTLPAEQKVEYKKSASAEVHTLAASVTTYSSGSSPVYTFVNGVLTPSAQNSKGTHVKNQYFWSTSVLKSNGAVNTFVPFNWTRELAEQAQEDSRWKLASQNTYLDPYSHLVEQKDLNGSYASILMDAKNMHPIMSASNARMNEILFSGSEDTHLGSNAVRQVEEHANTRSTTIVHTGVNSLAVSGSNKGYSFICNFSTPIAAANLYNKKYRVSAWVHESNHEAFRFFTQPTGGAMTQYAPTISAKYGSWYLKQLDVIVSGAMEIGVFNTSAQVAYVDDFRFHPFHSSVSNTVYNAKGQAAYTFGNDHLYTRYEYYTNGKLKATYRETPNGERRMSEYKTGFKN